MQIGSDEVPLNSIDLYNTP